MMELSNLFRSPPAWLGFFIITIAVVVGSLWFLWPTPIELPMDDAYIHFVYAENLIDHGRLVFNFPGETGVGSTSLIWVLLLSGGHCLGLSMQLTAKVLGVASLLIVGFGLFLLLRFSWGSLSALICTILVVLSGHMLWFALSGMETTLFLAVGIVALLIYREEKWGWLGLTLGLLILIRPEGIALVIAVGLIEMWRNKGIHRGLLVCGLVAILICGSWFVYLFLRTGHFLPTSAVGKRLSMTTGIRLVAERNENIAFLGRFPALLYPFLWLGYILEFVLGGMSLPPPNIPVGNVLGNPEYTYSVWALIALVGVITPLLLACLKRVWRPRKWPHWVENEIYRPMIIFMVWVVLHNLIYMVALPIPGTASRYGALNHIALWVLLSIGLFSLSQNLRFRLWVASGLFVLALANTVYWNAVYDANIDHMKNVRIEAAHFIKNNLPSVYCAASDIGAIRFISQQPILDLSGLLDPELGQVFLEGQIDNYLVENNVSCLVLPGRIGTTQDGWFDVAEVLGISNTSLFDIDQIAEYEISRQRWLQGYLPTNNYQATVTIYRLVR